MATTKKAKGNVTGPGNMAQLRFNEPSCSDKMSEAGFNYFHSGGDSLLGALNSGVDIPSFRPVYVFNNSGSTTFVAFGDSSLAAPTDATDGVPIPANSGMVLNSGSNTRVRSSAATMFGFLAEDNIIE